MYIAICDDESYFRRVLQEQLTAYSNEYGYDFIIHEYKDGMDLLSSKLTFDLIFMDYQMKVKNGIDTVSVLRKRNDNTKVVFVSSYKDIVFESMKVQTFRFLVKPLDKEKLYEALNSVIKENQKIAQIVVKDEVNEKSVTIPETEIVYAQADNIYTTVVTTQGCFKYPNNITALENELTGDFFFRINRSYLVNFNYISSYSNKVIVFSNGQKAVIAKLKFKDFKSAYLTHLKRKSMGG